ncbi:MAG: hypothetical protein WC728_06335 [Elusimicrobiota bacterium]
MTHALVLLLACLPAFAEKPVPCEKLRGKLAGKKSRTPYPSYRLVPEACSGGDEPMTVVWTQNASPVAVHVISVETNDSAADNVIEVDVHPSERPIVLVLNAWHDVDWRVNNHGAVIQRVITQGHGDQELEGSDGDYKMGERYREDLCFYVADGAKKRDEEHGAEYGLMMSSLRAVTGYKEASFQSCSASSKFRVPPLREGTVAPKEPKPDPKAPDQQEFSIQIDVLPGAKPSPTKPKPGRKKPPAPVGVEKKKEKL